MLKLLIEEHVCVRVCVHIFFFLIHKLQIKNFIELIHVISISFIRK